MQTKLFFIQSAAVGCFELFIKWSLREDTLREENKRRRYLPRAEQALLELMSSYEEQLLTDMNCDDVRPDGS